MKLFYQYVFFNFSHTSTHLHPLQVENCDSNSRLVVDKDDNDSGLKGLTSKHTQCCFNAGPPWKHLTNITPMSRIYCVVRGNPADMRRSNSVSVVIVCDAGPTL